MEHDHLASKANQIRRALNELDNLKDINRTLEKGYRIISFEINEMEDDYHRNIIMKSGNVNKEFLNNIKSIVQQEIKKRIEVVTLELDNLLKS